MPSLGAARVARRDRGGAEKERQERVRQVRAVGDGARVHGRARGANGGVSGIRRRFSGGRRRRRARRRRRSARADVLRGREVGKDPRHRGRRARGEMAWYFPETREQFRATGTLACATRANRGERREGRAGERRNLWRKDAPGRARGQFDVAGAGGAAGGGGRGGRARSARRGRGRRALWTTRRRANTSRWWRCAPIESITCR